VAEATPLRGRARVGRREAFCGDIDPDRGKSLEGSQMTKADLGANAKQMK